MSKIPPPNGIPVLPRLPASQINKAASPPQSSFLSSRLVSPHAHPPSSHISSKKLSTSPSKNSPPKVETVFCKTVAPSIPQTERIFAEWERNMMLKSVRNVSKKRLEDSIHNHIKAEIGQFLQTLKSFVTLHDFCEKSDAFILKVIQEKIPNLCEPAAPFIQNLGSLKEVFFTGKTIESESEKRGRYYDYVEKHEPCEISSLASVALFLEILLMTEKKEFFLKYIVNINEAEASEIVDLLKFWGKDSTEARINKTASIKKMLLQALLETSETIPSADLSFRWLQSKDASNPIGKITPENIIRSLFPTSQALFPIRVNGKLIKGTNSQAYFARFYTEISQQHSSSNPQLVLTLQDYLAYGHSLMNRDQIKFLREKVLKLSKIIAEPKLSEEQREIVVDLLNKARPQVLTAEQIADKKKGLTVEQINDLKQSLRALNSYEELTSPLTIMIEAAEGLGEKVAYNNIKKIILNQLRLLWSCYFNQVKLKKLIDSFETLLNSPKSRAPYLLRQFKGCCELFSDSNEECKTELKSLISEMISLPFLIYEPDQKRIDAIQKSVDEFAKQGSKFTLDLPPNQFIQHSIVERKLRMPAQEEKAAAVKNILEANSISSLQKLLECIPGKKQPEQLKFIESLFGAHELKVESSALYLKAFPQIKKLSEELKIENRIWEVRVNQWLEWLSTLLSGQIDLWKFRDCIVDQVMLACITKTRAQVCEQKKDILSDELSHSKKIELLYQLISMGAINYSIPDYSLLKMERCDVSKKKRRLENSLNIAQTMAPEKKFNFYLKVLHTAWPHFPFQKALDLAAKPIELDNLLKQSDQIPSHREELRLLLQRYLDSTIDKNEFRTKTDASLNFLIENGVMQSKEQFLDRVAELESLQAPATTANYEELFFGQGAEKSRAKVHKLAELEALNPEHNLLGLEALRLLTMEAKGALFDVLTQKLNRIFCRNYYLEPEASSDQAEISSREPDVVIRRCRFALLRDKVTPICSLHMEWKTFPTAFPQGGKTYAGTVCIKSFQFKPDATVQDVALLMQFFTEVADQHQAVLELTGNLNSVVVEKLTTRSSRSQTVV